MYYNSSNYANLQLLLISTFITHFYSHYSYLQILRKSTDITQLYMYYSNLQQLHITIDITQIYSCCSPEKQKKPDPPLNLHVGVSATHEQATQALPSFHLSAI